MTRRSTDSPRTLTRRTVMRSTLAVVGAVVGHAIPLNAGRFTQQGAGSRPRVIRTLLGDLEPDSLTGSILFHEHLSGTTPFSDNVDLMVNEVREARQRGVACIVDGGHPDFKFTPGGYQLASLKRIATESGVPIVASGGYYTQRSYPEDLARLSAEQIADTLVRQAAEGGLGAFGEIGQAAGQLTPTERKVFQAVAMAQRRTGLPIFTHNAYSSGRPTPEPIPPDAALRQLDVLEAAGADVSHVAIGHVCCLDDPKATVAQQLAARGVFVGFDRVTLERISLPDALKVKMAMALVEAGYARNLMLSSDFFDEAALVSKGGAGIAQAATVFGPMLLKAGLPESTLRTILEDNPRRFLAFAPMS